MPVTAQGTITKEYLGYTWVNSYICTAADLSAAQNLLINAVLPFERSITYNQVLFTKVQVHGLNTADPNDLLTAYINLLGQRDLGGNPVLPPWNAAFVNFSAVTGRPGKKFYRYTLAGNEVIGQGAGAGITAVSTFPALITAGLTDLIDNVNAYGSLLVGTPNSATALREVVDGSFRGVAQIDVHHGWFNKSLGA